MAFELVTLYYMLLLKGTNTDAAAVAQPSTPVTWRVVSPADMLSV